MSWRRLLVAGGAGFVGSSLALSLKRGRPEADVVALDNLRRRGSELALARLADAGVHFRHGDLRQSHDLDGLGPFDAIVDCAAEPSVQAGYQGGLRYLLDSNLSGTVNLLELARRDGAAFLFLSTSRVFPIAGLRALPLEAGDSRLFLRPGAQGPGWSAAGVGETFPLEGARSFYGASKLSAELMVQEYAAAFGLPAVVNRCGVISGPGQMGKVDQGFFVHWVARHLYGGALAYRGFGGAGLQVRDLLAVDDLAALVARQLEFPEAFAGKCFNVGGGPDFSLSLAELTALCRERTGAAPVIGREPATHPSDVPWYVTDNAAVTAATGWRPRIAPAALLDSTLAWLREDAARLRPVLGA